MAVPFGVHINQRGQDVEKSFVFENVDQKNAALVVGGAGSGKTAFIHTFILSAACRYSPEELELYLIDLKGMGTGFYPFEKCHLPHVKVIYNGTDREFPLSVLKRIEHEVKVVRPAKNKKGEKYPRILLIIDESPVLFSEEDYIYNEAKRIINGINGLGREAKVNIMLSTQVLGNIPKKTWEQVAIRYVGCPPPGVMDTNNTLLGQSAKITANFTHGEAVFVERGMPTGDIENYHVKSYYIDAEHDNPTDVERIVQRLDAHAKLHPEECPNYGKCITFHHDEIVDFLVNERMSYEHSQPQNQTSLPSSVPLYVGSPVELAEHDVYFELQPADNNNVLIIGTVPDDSILGQSIALNMLRSGVMAYPKEQELRTDYVFDFSSPDASLHGGVEYFLGGKPFSKASAIIPNNEDEVVKKLKEVYDECDRRRKENVVPGHIYLTFLALEKANMFGTPNNVRKDATTCLKKLIEEGPKYGIFVIVQMIANSKRVREYLGIPTFDCISHYVISKMGEEAKTMFSSFGRAITKLYDDSVSCKEPSLVGLYRCLYFNSSSSSVKKFKPYNPIQNLKHNESD